MPLYTHAHMFACHVPTVVTIPNPVPAPNRPYISMSGWDLSAAPLPQPTMLTVPRVQSRDLHCRLTWLAYFVERAMLCSAQIGASPYEQKNLHRVLRVLVLPEFYFRPPSAPGFAYGAYSPAEFSELIGALEAIFHHPMLDDWLFVCGTAVTCDDQPRTNQSLLYNRAMIVFGNKPEKCCYVSKAFTSHIDGVDPAERPERHASMRAVTTSGAAEAEHFLLDYGIGIEICLEHGLGVLKQAVQNLRIPSGAVRLQILTAGGMTMQEDNVIVPRNGHFFRCDGYIQSSAKASGLYRRGQWKFSSISEAAVVSTSDFPLPANALRSQDKNVIKGYPLIEL